MSQKNIISTEKNISKDNLQISENLNAPKLRFPEFKEKWQQISIDEKFNFFTTSSFSRSKLNENKGKVKNIHYGDIHTKFPTIVDVQKENIPYIDDSVPKDKIDKYELCKDGDLLVADASEDYKDIGKTIELTNIQTDRIIGGLHTLLLRDKTNTKSKGFNGYLFQTKKLKHDIRIIANGISVLGISKKSLKKIKIRIPTIQEQEKIGTFLSNIDKKIALMEQKQEKLEKFKVSMLQQLLPVNDKVPTLKFTDFKNEWKNIEFDDFLDEVNIKTSENDQYPVLSSTKEKIYLQSEYFNNRNVASQNNKGYKILKKNQLVLSPQNLWMGNININLWFDIGIVSPSYKIYNINEDKVLIKFLNQIIKTQRLIYEYENASEQGASIVRRNLNKTLFDKIKIKIPTIQEQEKIGSFLLEIDKKIELTKEKIELMKKYKKGLLQKMFI